MKRGFALDRGNSEEFIEVIKVQNSLKYYGMKELTHLQCKIEKAICDMKQEAHHRLAKRINNIEKVLGIKEEEEENDGTYRENICGIENGTQ